MFGRTNFDAVFEKLFWDKRYLIQSIVKKYIKNSATVDDIVQKTFLKIYLNIKKIHNAEKQNAYIHRITVNTVFDCLRKNSNEIEITVDRLEEVFSDNLENREKELDNKMMVDLFKAHLMVLPKKRKAVVSLRIFEEKAFSEISMVLGMSEVSARNLFSIAIKDLRIKLAAEGRV